MADRRLIVLADDFGQSPDTTEAIIEAHQRGIVTEASLMANGDAFEQAVHRAAEVPGLGVGAHLALCDGRSLTRAEPLPATPDRFVAALLTRRLPLSFVAAELDAQMRRIVDAGIRPTHITGHQHLHLFPGVLGIVRRLTDRYGVHYLRIPKARDLAAGPWPQDREAKLRRLKLLPTALLARRTRDRDREPTAFLGLDHSGQLSEPSLLRLIDAVPEGLSELMCHPGFGQPGDGVYQTRRELEALCAPAVRERIEARGITLVRCA